MVNEIDAHTYTDTRTDREREERERGSMYIHTHELVSVMVRGGEGGNLRMWMRAGTDFKLGPTDRQTVTEIDTNKVRMKKAAMKRPTKTPLKRPTKTPLSLYPGPRSLLSLRPKT